MPILGWRGSVGRHFRNPIASMRRLQDGYGSVVQLVRGGNPALFQRPAPTPGATTVFGFGADANREILTQPHVFESDELRAPKGCDYLVHNMSSANGDRRKDQRRMMMPAFTKNHLRGYWMDMVRFTDRMLDGWQPDAEIELTRALEDLSADIASKTFYGQEPDGGNRTLAAKAREIVDLMFSPATMMSLNVPGSPYRTFLHRSRQAREQLRDEIERKRRTDDGGSDVLAMMLQTQASEGLELSETELIGNAFTLFVAGHDVPANALGFILLLLAQHPDEAAALDDELRERLGGRPPTFDELWQLPALDRVVKESMRVLCPSVVLWRRVTSDTTLGGHAVPAGTEVLFSPYLTHLDPERFPDPRHFRPSRWQGLRTSSFEFLPFSHGFRKCLGAAFAEMMLRLVTAMISQRYRLELVPKIKVDLHVTFTMKPKRGLPVIVRRADRDFDRSPAALRGYLPETMVAFPS